MRRASSSGALLACLLIVFVCRALVASAIVPPWQGPDEPTHFSLVWLLFTGLEKSNYALKAGEQEVQEEILASMGRHRWWEPYGGRTPDPPPKSFFEVPRLGVGVYSQPLYYGLGAAFLRVAPPITIEAAFWRLRILSIVLGLAAIGFGWAGTRLLLGPGIASGATAVAVLHPQFLLVSMSVNPDALLIPMGACLWWLIARVATERRRAMSFMLIIVTAAAVLLTKRSGIPLAAVTCLAAVGSLLTPVSRRMTSRTVASLAVLLGLGAITAVGAWATFQGAFTELRTFWGTALTFRRPLDDMLMPAAIEYAALAVDYVWLIGGWLRFAAPDPWHWAVRLLTVVGFAGAGVLLVRSPELRRPLSIAWLLVIVQVGTIVGWGFLTQASPQGRYLFPMIAPATALLWLGLTQATPLRVRPYAAPALVLILVILDITAFAGVLIPAYLPWG